MIVCTERILRRSPSARAQQIHPLFNRAASVVLDLNKSKPLMQCYQFVKATKKMKEIIVPIQEGLLQQSIMNVLHCVRTLERLFVDETEFAQEM